MNLSESALAARPRDSVALPWVNRTFLFLLVVGVLKGIRMPNSWAVSHYLFNYEAGFMKRALWGELLWRMLGQRSGRYFLLTAVACLVMGALLWLVVRESRRMAASPRGALAAVLLASSPSMVMLAHLIGYLEQVVYVALLAIVAARARPRLQAVLAAATAAVAPLVHEASVFWVGGLSVLAVLVPDTADASRPLRVRAAAGLLLLWLLSTGLTVRTGRITFERAELLLAERSAFADVPLHKDAFRTLAAPASEGLTQMRRAWLSGAVFPDAVRTFLTFAPGALLLLALAAGGAREAWSDRRTSTVTALVAAASVCAPLALNVIGWDIHRWSALAAFNAGCAALILAGSRREPRAVSPRTASLVLAVVVWGAAADVDLFDGYRTKYPPFGDHLLFVKDAIQHPARAHWLPHDGH